MPQAAASSRIIADDGPVFLEIVMPAAYLEGEILACNKQNGMAVPPCLLRPCILREFHMTFIHAILFAILQGASELFPVSSLGHAVVVPAVLHWGIDQASPTFLPFLVMLHFG